MIVKTYSVFCDARIVCVGSWVSETTEGAWAARAEAKRQGWIRKPGRDVCPACNAVSSSTRKEPT